MTWESNWPSGFFFSPIVNVREKKGRRMTTTSNHESCVPLLSFLPSFDRSIERTTYIDRQIDRGACVYGERRFVFTNTREVRWSSKDVLIDLEATKPFAFNLYQLKPTGNRTKGTRILLPLATIHRHQCSNVWSFDRILSEKKAIRDLSFTTGR